MMLEGIETYPPQLDSKGTQTHMFIQLYVMLTNRIQHHPLMRQLPDPTPLMPSLPPPNPRLMVQLSNNMRMLLSPTRQQRLAHM